MASKLKYEDLMTSGKELIAFYREHPCTAAYELLGVDFAPIQRLVFRDMWFKNYVITVAGRGFGKSNDINNLCISTTGIVHLNEVLPPIPSYLQDGEDTVIDWDDEVFTSVGFRHTKKLCLEKGIIGKHVQTQSMFETKGSSHHPLLTMNSDCEFVYKKLEDLVPGDKVCIQRGQNAFGSNDIPKEDAYELGKLLSDDTTVNTNSILLNKYKVERTNTYYKKIPLVIRTATRAVQKEFLTGYLDNQIDSELYDHVSKVLVQEVQIMLLNMGIVTSIVGTSSGYYLNKSVLQHERIPYATSLCTEILQSLPISAPLHISDPSSSSTVIRSSDTLNLGVSTSSELLYCDLSTSSGLLYCDLSTFLTACDIIVSAGYDLSEVQDKIDKLREIAKSNYFFDTVVSVEDWKGDCYDFEMDMEQDIEPNYFSNGFINHNTFTLGTLAVLSAMLYPGNRIGLIGPVFRQSFVIKSDTYDTFWTSQGMVTGSENMYNNAVPNLTRIQSVHKQNTILSKWLNDERACINIETTRGFEMAGSIDHAILVLDRKRRNNTLKYKELQDINEDDYIVIRKGFNYFGNNDSMPKFDEFKHDWRTKDCLTPKELTPDLAYWVGLLLGDGCVSVSKNKRKQRVDFVSEDQDLLDSFERYLREYFLVDKQENIRRDNRRNKTWEIQYFCKKLVQYLLKCGFTKTTALDKKIPAIIKKASREVFISFLQGLFDTDGGVYIQEHKTGTHCEITYSTSSIQLGKEVHAALLNLGIVANLGVSVKAGVRQLSQGNKPSKCATGYKIRITGLDNVSSFSNIIGFRNTKRKNLLDTYLADYANWERPLANSLGLTNKIVEDDIEFFENLALEGIYFVKLKQKDYFFADTFDIEVDDEHCYWGNGFINHNSKMIFGEVEKLYDQSSILREACTRKPTRGSDTCLLKFKAVGGKTPSMIEALPLGNDGSKIRGSRYYLILVDELAQVPDQILDLVLRPMGATALAPMERVRRLEEQARLIASGLATEDDFKEESVNKLIMTSSGYYKFNHMWRRMQDHWKMMDEADRNGTVSDYAVWQVPYWDLPTGFLDKKNIQEARRIMSNSEFRMEYEAAMISDSEGFFKASLLEECTLDSGYSMILNGDTKASFILGVDPNQGGANSCGAVLIQIGKPLRIVNVLELKKQTTQELTKAIQSICNRYNVVRVFMDKGGGGKAIMDLLEDGYNGEEPILSRDNPDNLEKDGRHILDMINFNPSWISDANFTTKALFEDKLLRFPELTVTASDALAKAYNSIVTLKAQLLSIVVTQTSTGILHFDTPSKSMNKDLYSALILAAHGANLFDKEVEEDNGPVMLNTSGCFRRHDAGASFRLLGNNAGAPPAPPVANIDRKGSIFSAAVLKKTKK